MFRFLACFFTGHRWQVVCTNYGRSATLGHLHTMAGQDADCERCGKQWRDAKGPDTQPAKPRKPGK